MSGHRPWSEIRSETVAQPGAREEIDAIKRAIEEVLSLIERRNELRIAEEDLDRALDACFPELTRTEALYLSTLRGYVEALGGRLEINAVFPERTVTLTSGH